MINTTERPTVKTSIGMLVMQRPSRSRVFDRLGIDYCCGGKKSLFEACSAMNLNPDAVLAQVLATESDQSSDEIDWSSASLIELSDYIEQTHHSFLKQELPRLGAMVRKVAAVHGDRHPWMLEVDGVYAGFVGQMQSHMLKEEQMLFPLIRRLDNDSSHSSRDGSPSIEVITRVMKNEHADVVVALERLRSLSRGFRPPANACNTFIAMLDGLRELEADTHLHIHRENNILFPLAEASEAALRQHVDSRYFAVANEPSNWFG